MKNRSTVNLKLKILDKCRIPNIIKNIKEMNPKSKLKYALLGTLFLITVGYASIHTSLGMKGLLSLMKNEDFKVIFSNLRIDGIEFNGFISADGQQFSFNTNNLKKGGTSVLDYTISNESSKYKVDVGVTCTPEVGNNASLEYDKSTKSLNVSETTNGSINATVHTSNNYKDLYGEIVGLSKGLDTANGINYNVISSSSNGQGVFETNNTDSGRNVYFYRGNVNNNLIYANKCWKILRTTETNGIKLIYNGVPNNGVCSNTGDNVLAFKSAWNSVQNDNTYVGYMHGQAGATSYSAAHSNSYNSDMKSAVDKWYEQNIFNTEYERLLEDTVYCNDRSLVPYGASGNNYGLADKLNGSMLGYGNNHYTIYGANSRFANNVSTANPSLKCTLGNDRFTVDGANGNGDLKYPIGLITADEVGFAGATIYAYNDGSTSNEDYFLYGGGSKYYTMSPNRYDDRVIMGAVNANDDNYNGYFGVEVATSQTGVRPVVSLKNGVTYSKGNGTENNPYFIEMDAGENFTCTLNIKKVEEVEKEEENLVGQELCLGEECFYILDHNEENYTLFAKHNLYVGYINNGDIGTIRNEIPTSDPQYGKQSEIALGDATELRYGTVAYGYSSNYETSIIKPYVDDYSKYLNDTFNINTTGRLVTIEDLKGLGCVVGGGPSGVHGCDYPDYSKYPWVLGSTYWTGSPGTAANTVYIVGADGYYNAVASITNEMNRCVRPVIVVPTKEIEKLKKPDKPDNPTSQVPEAWKDNGIFSAYYDQAYEKLQTMNLNEKIGQLLIVRYSDSGINDAIVNYHVAGTTFYAIDFTGKNESQVKSMTAAVQSSSKIPMITAVDEEGGTVVRVSSNPNLATTPFKSPSEVFSSGGLTAIRTDTVNKSALLRNLGLNMNFAPVVDIADPEAYIYKRTLKQDAATTGQFAVAVVNASKNTGVSYSLKHFPGYGNNADTHISSSADQTNMEELRNKHLVPFVAGIDAGAEAVMIAHNKVSALDKQNPASLSKPVHDLLYNDLNFTGVSMTDDLDMDAAAQISDRYTRAVLAGNNLILLSDYAGAKTQILNSVNNGTITEEQIDKLVFKTLAWKYYKGLLS